MDSSAANPAIIILMFVARCLVPLVIMLGISYLLRKLGLIPESPQPPEGEVLEENASSATEGDLVHGKV